MTPGPGDDSTLGTGDLITRLQEHQDELEAQNHQLRALQVECRATMERFRVLYDLAPIGYLTLDESGVILEANLTLSDLVGAPREALTGRRWSDFVHRDDQDVYFKEVRSKLTRPGRGRSELRIRHPTRPEVWVLFDFTVILNDPTGSWQAMCAAADITEDRQRIAAMARSRDLFRTLARRLQDARDQEHTDLSARVYEQISQDLVALGFDIRELEHSMSSRVGPGDRDILTAAMTVLQACHQTLDDELLNLHPPILDIMGLPAAIQSELTRFSEATGIEGFFDMPISELQLPDNLRSALFYILREGLDNVRQHADARTVRVSLERRSSTVVMVLLDDGRGVPEAVAAGEWGPGLTGASERADRFGGSIEVSGDRARGTRLRVTVPLDWLGR